MYIDFEMITTKMTQMESYYFRHWANIDTFVYFSHHLLTIPPPGALSDETWIEIENI